ncbi:putative secreted protein [Mycobacterium kansasii 662]|uniref:Putative secreted protein n=1 Tax=Mycobacterium kansasii 662 TaxID=1299326 RepID=X7ZHI8_MYCKA|nr:putative secreted protein [Mycobacterium kansasii 662]
MRETTWKWDCLLPDGTIEYDPAKSIAAYTPGPHGILTGVFHTDITSGACKGNVDMPVSAKPAFEPESVI